MLFTEFINMTEPWHGSAPPETPVTVTLSYRTAKRVLDAVVRDGHRAINRGNDPVGVELLAGASEALGTALAAPPHRRFTPARRYAVVAITATDFVATCRDLFLDESIQPVWVSTLEGAREACYVGFTVSDRARRKMPDIDAIVETVVARTFPR